MAAERAEQVAADRRQPLAGARVQRSGMLERGDDAGLAGGARGRDVAAVRLDADAGQKVGAAVQGAGRLELVAQHRRQRQRQRRAGVEQRRAAAGTR